MTLIRISAQDHPHPDAVFVAFTKDGICLQQSKQRGVSYTPDKVWLSDQDVRDLYAMLDPPKAVKSRKGVRKEAGGAPDGR